MKLSSTFQNGDYIPSPFSYDGKNKSPPLSIEDVPASAKSLVLIMDDPDAPHGTFTHWIVFDFDPKTSAISEGEVPSPAFQGANDWGQARYAGPKPPYGEHRYFFRLYALDQKIGLPNGSARANIEKKMKDHVISTAEFMGRYAAAEKSVGVNL